MWESCIGYKQIQSHFKEGTCTSWILVSLGVLAPVPRGQSSSSITCRTSVLQQGAQCWSVDTVGSVLSSIYFFYVHVFVFIFMLGRLSGIELRTSCLLGRHAAAVYVFIVVAQLLTNRWLQFAAQVNESPVTGSKSPNPLEPYWLMVQEAERSQPC